MSTFKLYERPSSQHPYIQQLGHIPRGESGLEGGVCREKLSACSLNPAGGAMGGTGIGCGAGLGGGRGFSQH